jgi:SAM-dependent methyltransferase
MSGSAAREILAGAEYVKQITALESDRRARAAFQELVVHIAPPGGALFDFGAGPGIDARFYAERGFTVAAYDVDPKMREFFAVHCRDLIDAGRVTLDGGNYQEFLARKTIVGSRSVDLVTSNFAVLNLVPDLKELFSHLHALTAPHGKVLASVLSPYFIGDLKYGWWWRNALRLWRYGQFSVPGIQAPIMRRRLANYAAQSAPYFTLERVFRGLPAQARQARNGVDANGAGPNAWLRVTRSRFMFLLFARRDRPELRGLG